MSVWPLWDREGSHAITDHGQRGRIMIDLKKLFEETPILRPHADWEKQQMVCRILRWPVLFRRLEYIAGRKSMHLCLSIPFPRRDPMTVDPHGLTIQLFTIRDKGGVPPLRAQQLDEIAMHDIYHSAGRRYVVVDGRVFDF